MKRSLLALVFISLSISFYSQSKIKKIEVAESGYSIKLDYTPIVEVLNYKGLEINISPVSPSQLNDKFNNESTFNGKYEYSNYENNRQAYFLKRSKRKREKSDFEFFLEGADWLLENEIVTNKEYINLRRKIFSFYVPNDVGFTNSTTLSNPYFLNGKYLSVFKIELINESNNFISFDENLLIESGDLLLNPISREDLINRLKLNEILNENKIQTLDRYHLTSDVVVPPNSKSVKYFATVPLNYNNDDICVSFEGLTNKFKWNLIKNNSSINDTYIYFELDYGFYFGSTSISVGPKFSSFDNNENVYVTDDGIFIDEKSINDEFQQFTLMLYGEHLYYSKESFIGSESLDFEKEKRKKIIFDLTKIEELKKKVKL